MERRIRNFRKVLSSKGLDAILLANFWAVEPNSHNYNLYYISNLLRFFPWCYLILTEDEYGVWVDTGDLERAREQSWLKRIEPMELKHKRYSTEDFAEAAAKNLRELIGRDTIKVGVDGRYLPSSVTISLIKEGLQVEDVTLNLEKSRLIKDERELELLGRAAEIVDKGIEKAVDSVREGVTERELSVFAEYEMRRRGAECFWWPNIITSGSEAESWANSPTNRKIKRGDLVWMDFSPVYMGYLADVARTFVYGEADEKQLKVFNLAEKALDEAASSLRDGVTIGEVMKAAAEPVRNSTYERFYIGPGHGIGLYNSVYPVFLSSISEMKSLPTSLLEMKLVEGMTIAIEIVFTIPGLGGVRLEDDYLITRNQTEKLTKAPITATVTS